MDTENITIKIPKLNDPTTNSKATKLIEATRGSFKFSPSEFPKSKQKHRICIPLGIDVYTSPIPRLLIAYRISYSKIIPESDPRPVMLRVPLTTTCLIESDATTVKHNLSEN